MFERFAANRAVMTQVIWQKHIARMKDVVEKLNFGELTLDMIKAALTGEEVKANLSFIGVWEDMCEHMMHDSN